MKPKQYRKKPVVIEAIRLSEKTADDIMAWLDKDDARFTAAYRRIFISTLEGDMRADYGDWIIKGVKGEFYPCKPDIFKQTYEAVK